MKNRLPDIPHSISWFIANSPAGREFPAVLVEFPVPSRVAAHLLEHGTQSIIPCAGIGDVRNLAHRARRWNHPFQGSPAHRDLFLAAVDEGCDTMIRVGRSGDEWHLVGHLCGLLRITPGQWFVGSAVYNAAIEEQELEEQLEAI